ncbi:MAG: hypothetical protein NT024_00570 [Proteobacteria bacterium]|nr:hypothetical protein [Pseudomonadota bacterium]
MTARKHHVNIGDRFGALVVESTDKKVIFRCDCGKQVTNLSPWNVVVSGCRSCGCGKHRMGYINISPAFHEQFIIMQPMNAEEKAAYRTHKVKCKTCNRVQVMSQASLKNPIKRLHGCRYCYVRARERAQGEP